MNTYAQNISTVSFTVNQKLPYISKKEEKNSGKIPHDNFIGKITINSKYNNNDQMGNIKISQPTSATHNSYNNNVIFGQLLEDNLGELELVDARQYMPRMGNVKENTIIEDIPTKISGTYNEDYNILYVDEIIRKKLRQEKFNYVTGLQLKYKNLIELSKKPQTYVMREKTLESIKKLEEDINQIESGEKLNIYDSKVKNILVEYRKFNGRVKTVIFDMNDEEKYEEMDDDLRYRAHLIENFLEIASEYIQIDITKINNKPADICNGCGMSLAKVATNEAGTIRCPNLDCQTEHNVIILAKLAKDGSRINTNNSTDDESIDNFLRAFTRYQGLQPEQPDNSLYKELDAYFARYDRPPGHEIRKLSLNSRGRRGDTDHKMLLDALSQTGRSEYYEDVNLIGHLYWGWTLPKVMHLRERIIDKYNKTQKVFYQIPPDQRERTSSLGTQYRLWRHLQLEGHECYMDEFKIAENSESLRTHNKLWKLMCDGTNDPDIRYIP